MYNQMLAYIETFLSPYLFGYRQGYSTEQCLIVMLENGKSTRWKAMCRSYIN